MNVTSPLLNDVKIALILLIPFVFAGCAETQRLREIKLAQDRYISELEDQSKSFKDAYYKLVEQRNKEQEDFNARVFKLEREIERLKSERLEKEKELLHKNQELQMGLQVKTREITEREAEHKAEAKKLSENVTELQNRISKLQREKSDAVTNADTLSSQIAQLGTTIENLKAENKSKDSVLIEKDRMISDRDKSLKSAENEIEKLKSEHRTSKSHEVELSARVKDLENKLSAALSEKNATEKASAKNITPVSNTAKEDTSLDEAQSKLNENLSALINLGDVKLAKTNRGLVITIQNESLFQPGSVILKSEAKQLLSRIAEVLSQYKERLIYIEGHTDSQPIENLPFYDNIGLSSARADNVVRYFIEDKKNSPDRLKAVSCGEFYPVDSNNTASGRKQNRRVEIILSRH